MPRVTPIYGIVLDNGGDTPRKASLIDYAVELTMPTGQVELDHRIQPNDQRPPDQVDGEDLETIPLAVGSPFTAYMIGGEIQFIFNERPAMAKCSTPAGRDGNGKPPKRDAAGNIIPDDQPPGGGPSPKGGSLGGGVGAGGVITR